MYAEELRIAVCGRKEQIDNYMDALSALGVDPIHVEDEIDPLEFDGLLLPGGADVSPARYHAEINGSVRIDEELDEWQLTALAKFVALKKPVFGICRGHQLINIFFGGTMIQHIDCYYLHARDAGSDQDKVHINFAEAGSYIANLYGTRFYTNSSHHQVVDRVGEDLHVVQRSEQGLVEAMYHDSLPIWSVQWHPERMCFAYRRDDTVDGSVVLKWYLDNCAGLKAEAGKR